MANVGYPVPVSKYAATIPILHVNNARYLEFYEENGWVFCWKTGLIL